MYFSDFFIGQQFETNEYKVTEEEIKSFAQQFDPQYMHLDLETARQSQFQGIIASGIHTLNISFRLWIDVGAYGDEIIAGRKMDKIVFCNAVYPNDILRVHIKVIEMKKLKGQRGLVTKQLTTYNQKDKKVLTALLTAYMKDK